MPASWSIENWPPCEFHVFLSHCAEDRERLVLPVYKHLQSEGVTPWIDRHDYPSRRNPFEALRENRLRCRHVVYLITPAMPRQPRGWTVVERTCAELIQQRMHHESFDLQSVELPLFLVDRSHPALVRSIWSTLADRGRFIRPRKRRIPWCVAETVRYLLQEQRVAEEIASLIARNSKLRARLAGDDNLRLRVVGAIPEPIPGPIKPSGL